MLALPPSARRIVIAGGPRTGKTTLARQIAEARGLRHREGDYLYRSGVGWSDSSAQIAGWFAEPGGWVIEGVQVSRAIRKYFAANDAAPCDVLIWCTDRQHDWQPRHSPMEKACRTVFLEVRPMLTASGVMILGARDCAA